MAKNSKIFKNVLRLNLAEVQMEEAELQMEEAELQMEKHERNGQAELQMEKHERNGQAGICTTKDFFLKMSPQNANKMNRREITFALLNFHCFLAVVCVSPYLVFFHFILTKAATETY